MSKRIFTGLICLTFFCRIVNGQKTKYNEEKDNILRNKINKILQDQVDSNKIPGAVIEVKQKGTVVFERSYGLAQKYDFNHRELSAPDKMTVEHLFDIASLTKVVGTTTSIMLLVDRGLIKVDDPVGKYIKAFAAPDKAAITIRHLLTHTAGLYEWYPMFYRAHNKQETFKLIGDLPLAFP